MAKEVVVDGTEEEEAKPQTSAKELQEKLDGLLKEDYKLQDDLRKTKDKRAKISEEMATVTEQLTAAQVREAGSTESTKVNLGSAQDKTKARKEG